MGGGVFRFLLLRFTFAFYFLLLLFTFTFHFLLLLSLCTLTLRCGCLRRCLCYRRCRRCRHLFGDAAKCQARRRQNTASASRLNQDQHIRRRRSIDPVKVAICHGSETFLLKLSVHSRHLPKPEQQHQHDAPYQPRGRHLKLCAWRPIPVDVAIDTLILKSIALPRVIAAVTRCR